MRVGQIIKLIPDRKFGFIRTDHFRDDVFFHFSKIDGIPPRMLEEGLDVQFEINEILRLDEQKLEATIVQLSARPLTKTLDEQRIAGMRASHHPRARQRKPSWREKSNPPSDNTPMSDAAPTESVPPPPSTDVFTPPTHGEES